MTAITFLPGERPERNRGLMRFSALVDGKKVECAVSFRELIVPFRGDLYNPEGTFKANRPHIEHIAAHKILHGLFEPDETILLRTEDFPKQ
jgi:Protein of unknown function (DUF1488)